MNPILQNLTRNQMAQTVRPIKDMMNMLNSSGNPQMMLQNMMSQNPRLKEAMDYVNANGGNPKEAFYKLAKERGINPDDIISMLK